MLCVCTRNLKKATWDWPGWGRRFSVQCAHAHARQQSVPTSPFYQRRQPQHISDSLTTRPAWLHGTTQAHVAGGGAVLLVFAVGKRFTSTYGFQDEEWRHAFEKEHNNAWKTNTPTPSCHEVFNPVHCGGCRDSLLGRDVVGAKLSKQRLQTCDAGVTAREHGVGLYKNDAPIHKTHNLPDFLSRASPRSLKYCASNETRSTAHLAVGETVRALASKRASCWKLL